MKLNAVQSLRALAVILVVYAHSIGTHSAFTISFQKNFYFLKDFGAIGADLFFIISGFIISYVADKYEGAKEGVTFLKKRFLRINPVYYLASVMQLTLLYFTHYPLNIANGCRDVVIMIPILNSQTTLSPILGIGWTLSFEWWFYMLFFLVVFFKVNNKALLLIFLIPMIVSIRYVFNVEDFRLVFFTNPMILEFLFGVTIYWFYYHIEVSGRAARVILLLGMAGYLYNIVIGYGDVFDFTRIVSGYSSLKRVIVWGLPSACIVAGCIFYEKNDILFHLWNNRLILLIGNASYSIYLVHIPIFYSFCYLQYRFFLNPDFFIFLQMFIALAVGIFFYKFIEKPLLKVFQSRAKPVIPAFT